jgi:hypothetical protein
MLAVAAAAVPADMIRGAEAEAARTVLREISMFPRAFFVRRAEVRRHCVTSAKSEG